MQPIHFEQQPYLDGFVYVYLPADAVPVETHWPGLYQDWPDHDHTPFTEFAINNSEQEEMAVYFGLAWHLTQGLTRYAIPLRHRDDAARAIGGQPELVDWEYVVDSEIPAVGERVVGFSRSQVADRDQRLSAGLFEVHVFRDLVLLQQALSDTSSAINLFAVRPGVGRKRRLLHTLRSPSPPRLTDVLDTGEVLIDVTIGMDLGTWSSLTVASLSGLRERLDELSSAFEGRVTEYENKVPAIGDVTGFLSAMRELAALD
ncbi:hypothetical protein DI270_030785 [Microbispora triticiradicis]|uniref:Uncharacterized protein n=1 Tax=Microbispora triticiradicis TaxID=2200763 RepID=A0ABX9LC68_9ACTN|nr:hypothetical protein [Microbispora triticiradicis]RGA01231.1 hypothetical protein DI270_030785 [Microbispora triticiradicis]GLW22566.1 hypothetical protein Mame01_26090 [Microbispora amethystogenes]